MIDYTILRADEAQPQLGELTAVLQACVADGASVGFIDAADEEVMTRFWQQRIAGLADGDSELFVARQHGRIVALSFSVAARCLMAATGRRSANCWCIRRRAVRASRVS